MPRVPALPFARAGVTEGIGANKAYAKLQAAAYVASQETGQQWSIPNRDVFRQIYAGVTYVRGQIPNAIAAPKNVPGGGLRIESRPSTVAGGFLYAVAAFTRPEGSADIEKTIHMSRSNTLLTPQQVEDATRAQIEQSAQETHGTFTGYTIEALTFTGVEQLTQRQT